MKDILAVFLAFWKNRLPERVDGVTATRWETGYFTRGRTDLPYPTREKEAS